MLDSRQRLCPSASTRMAGNGSSSSQVRFRCRRTWCGPRTTWSWRQRPPAVGALARGIPGLRTEPGTPGAPRWRTRPVVRSACDNDVCLENVVFDEGVAVGLLDFDFCAPGRPVYDLAQFARMCVPIDDDINAGRLGWRDADRRARLRLVADAYGLPARGRSELLAVLDVSIERGGEFVRRRVDAGDPNFIAMWNNMGGAERFDRRRRWWAARRDWFARELR